MSDGMRQDGKESTGSQRDGREYKVRQGVPIWHSHRPRREPLRYATYTYYLEIPRTRTISILQKPGGLMPTKRCLAMGYNQSLSLPAIHDHFLVTVTVKALES